MLPFLYIYSFLPAQDELENYHMNRQKNVNLKRFPAHDDMYYTQQELDRFLFQLLLDLEECIYYTAMILRYIYIYMEAVLLRTTTTTTTPACLSISLLTQTDKLYRYPKPWEAIELVLPQNSQLPRKMQPEARCFEEAESVTILLGKNIIQIFTLHSGQPFIGIYL